LKKLGMGLNPWDFHGAEILGFLLLYKDMLSNGALILLSLPPVGED
jgi:hypothetical protein